MMQNSVKAQNILSQINSSTKLGDLRKIAQKIKKDQDLALEIWNSGQYLARLLAILIMDKKKLTQDLMKQLDQDLQKHSFEERNHLADWLMANQLAKDKKTIELIESWQTSTSVLQRRIFWYYQGRKRWVGQEPPADTAHLLTTIENEITQEDPAVQWAMNFTAGWIGVYDKKYRNRCIQLGEKTKLYKGKAVSKGCTPEYLPEFIQIESSKRNL